MDFSASSGNKVVDASGQPLKVYHVTNSKFNKFNFKMSYQGIVWFTDRKESTADGTTGASLNGEPIVMERNIFISNPAGWDEYEKLGLEQIQGRGFDGIILKISNNENNYIVFNNKQIQKPIKRLKITEQQYRLLTEYDVVPHGITPREHYNTLEYVQEAIIELTKSNPQEVARLAELVYEDAGYHAGTLGDKSDYLGNGYRGDMPFTGYYFIGEADKVINGTKRKINGEYQFRICDFSQYKLLKLSTTQYWHIKYWLKSFEDQLLRSKDFEYSWKNFRTNMKNYFWSIDNSKSAIEEEWKRWYESLSSPENKIRFETRVLQIMGYEGVDVRHTKETGGEASPNSFSEGSVIFDLKPNTYTTLAEAYINRLNNELVREMGNALIYFRKNKEMNKIKITESQFNRLMAHQINESMMSTSSLSSDNSGSVAMKKDTNPNDIKKLTDKGLNVSLIDEELGEEQEMTYRHKFEGGKLNVYATKEKAKVEDIMDYVYSIKDQGKVEKAFEKGKVHLFVKDAASGRYQEMDKKIEHKYYKNIQGFKNFSKSAPKEPKSDGGELTLPSDEI